MSYSVSYNASGEKVEFISVDGGLTKKQLDEIVSIGVMDRIQFAAVPEESCLRALNEQYYSKYPQTGFRIYGLYDECDLSFLKYLTNIEKLSIESSGTVVGTDSFTAISNLKKLRFCVYLFQDFNFVKSIPKTLEQLAISTKSTAFNLSLLEPFQSLKVLHLHAYKKNIESLVNLKGLESLMLIGITPKSYDFLNQLNNLRLLKIHRGNKNDFSEIYGNNSITALQLFRISHLNSIEVLSQLPNLEAVELCQLPHVKQFPVLASHTKLKHIHLDDLKSLSDFKAIESIPNLNSFSFSVCPPTIETEQILPVLRNKSLARCSFFTANSKKNQQITELIKENKKQEYNNFITVRNLLFSNCTEI